MIRLKDGFDYRVVKRHEIPDLKLPAGVKEILKDWTVSLPGWDQELHLRLVVYRLADKRVISSLTSRHDLSALSIVLPSSRVGQRQWLDHLFGRVQHQRQPSKRRISTRRLRAA